MRTPNGPRLTSTDTSAPLSTLYRISATPNELSTKPARYTLESAVSPAVGRAIVTLGKSASLFILNVREIVVVLPATSLAVISTFSLLFDDWLTSNSFTQYGFPFTISKTPLWFPNFHDTDSRSTVSTAEPPTPNKLPTLSDDNG